MGGWHGYKCRRGRNSGMWGSNTVYRNTHAHTFTHTGGSTLLQHTYTSFHLMVTIQSRLFLVWGDTNVNFYFILCLTSHSVCIYCKYSLYLYFTLIIVNWNFFGFWTIKCSWKEIRTCQHWIWKIILVFFCFFTILVYFSKCWQNQFEMGSLMPVLRQKLALFVTQ